MAAAEAETASPEGTPGTEPASDVADSGEAAPAVTGLISMSVDERRGPLH